MRDEKLKYVPSRKFNACPDHQMWPFTPFDVKVARFNSSSSSRFLEVYNKGLWVLSLQFVLKERHFILCIYI